VHSQVPNTHFLVVGDGPRRQDLEALADELKITHCVHFTGTRADVPELLSLLDVFLLTSHNEASPVSVLEAMSSGIPVVTTNVGSLSEIVIDGDVGYLVPPGDDDEMILRAVELLRSPDARAALGQAARQRVINHWSVDTMVHGYERLMLRLWSQKSGQPIENITRHDNINSDDMQQVNLIDV
jgi:glycosyltransferase involved in cell wall biosynthesis